MHRGYIALWRKIKDHPFATEPREFSKYEAWIDLLMEAQHNYEPQRVMIGMNVLWCHYGECLKSVTTWADRWKWSRSKVFRFLKLLKKMDQIHYTSETVTTRIKIINYKIYDPRRNGDETEIERERNASETQAVTDKNVKNVKNVKNNPPIVPPRPKKKFTPPTEGEAQEYFTSNGYSAKAAKRFYDYYNAGNWHDQAGKPVKSWKQKAIAVWFKPENKAGGNGNGTHRPTSRIERNKAAAEETIRRLQGNAGQPGEPADSACIDVACRTAKTRLVE